MKTFNCVIVVTAILALSGLNALAQTRKDNPECKPNPVFNRFAGEVMGNCDQARFKDIELTRWKKPGDSKSGSESFKVEGEYWYFLNPVQKDAQGQPPGTLEIVRNFENAVQQAKGEVLFVNSKYVHYHLRKGDAEFWGKAGCGSESGGGGCGAIQHQVIRVAGMEQSVVVSSEQIARAMGDEGKVVLYGIYFDTDKATLKSESTPTLAEMAKWLKANASAKVFVVGHTDMQGSVERNQKLSRDRAASVIAALTKEYGIQADRLAADGVGPLAPVASNAGEGGRAKNRRVEMVLR
jgi:outer membrane protein OmpA-like peptidoglycan-associated protein